MNSVGPDVQLVQRARAGDRQAFGELYDRHAPMVRAWCFDGLLDLDEAHDACQEVFLRCWRQLDRIQQGDRIGGWLRGVAQYVVQERRRSRRRDRLEFRESPPSPATSTDFAAPAEREEMLHALARLPDPERSALHLYYLREQPSECARAVLGLSRAGFFKALQRGRERLHRTLSCSGDRHERS